MTLSKQFWAAAACSLLASTAFAAPEPFTLESGAPSSTFIEGLGFAELEGVGTFSASKRMVSALNLVSARLKADPPATLNVTASTTSTGRTRYVGVDVASPLTQLSLTPDGGQFAVTSAQMDGGMVISTIKNLATNGAGSLSISDLKVDLAKKTIYADIVGANGVGAFDDRALWTYDTVAGATKLAPNFGNPADVILLPQTLTFSGLFMADFADIDNIFVKALNLNAVGRSGLASVGVRSLSNTQGFGTLTITAVPEPEGAGLLVAGLVGVWLVARQRRVGPSQGE